MKYPEFERLVRIQSNQYNSPLESFQIWMNILRSTRLDLWQRVWGSVLANPSMFGRARAWVSAAWQIEQGDCPGCGGAPHKDDQLLLTIDQLLLTEELMPYPSCLCCGHRITEHGPLGCQHLPCTCLWPGSLT